MKLIKAIVHIDIVEDLRLKLFELGAPGVTLDNVTGIGKPLGHLSYSEAKGFTPKFSGNTRIEIVVDDERVDEICQTIVAVCRTGNVGDGKIFVLPVEKVIRIRTGEVDKEALY